MTEQRPTHGPSGDAYQRFQDQLDEARNQPTDAAQPAPSESPPSPPQPRWFPGGSIVFLVIVVNLIFSALGSIALASVVAKPQPDGSLSPLLLVVVFLAGVHVSADLLLLLRRPSGVLMAVIAIVSSVVEMIVFRKMFADQMVHIRYEDTIGFQVAWLVLYGAAVCLFARDLRRFPQ